MTESSCSEKAHAETRPDGAFTGASPWLVFLFILVCVFVSYIPAISAGFIWDDDFHVFNNPHLLDIDGLRRIWFTTESQQYYPLVYSSFWIEHQIWGDNPMGYHVVNMILHSINAFLVYRILTYLRIRGAVAVALVFAVHPVHVESVAWVSERKNVLSGLFYLAAFLSYLKFDDGLGGKHYARSIALFVAALLSKTVTATLPPALILARWMRGRAIGVKDLARLAPFFAVGLALGLVTVAWEVKLVGASGEDFALSPLERLLLPGRVSWFYVSKLLAPYDLIFFYRRWVLDASSFIQWLYPAALLGVLAALFFFRKRIGRKPFAGAAFFVLTLFPALGFFNVYPFRNSFVADHFQYLASIGVVALVVGVAARALDLFAGEKSGACAKGAVAAVVFALSFLSFRQCRIYENQETLWRDTLRKNPAAWMAHVNLGNVLVHTGRQDEGLAHFFRAIELKPGYELPYFNVGNELTKRGLLEEANRYYRKAIELKPDYGNAHYNLANNLYASGRLDVAIAHYEKAVAADPDDALFRINFGNALARTGRLEEAADEYEEALRIDPGSAEAKKNLGYVKRHLR